MFAKLSKHRQFSYTPRLYSPEKEEKERGRPPIRFQHLRHKTKSRSYIWLIAMLFFIVYLMIVLSKFTP